MHIMIRRELGSAYGVQMKHVLETGLGATLEELIAQDRIGAILHQPVVQHGEQRPPPCWKNNGKRPSGGWLISDKDR